MITLYDQVKKIECGWKSQRIDIAGQNIILDDVIILGDVLGNHHSIRSLGIRGCSIEEENLVRLARAIKNSGLISVQASAVKMTHVGAAAFATAIQESGVKRLDISQNEIGPEGCVRIAEALKDCGLESLILCKNNVGSEAVVHLALVLKTAATTLKVLDVSRNNIGDSGAEALALAMPSTKLTCLLLDSNALTLRGYKALCDAVIQTPAMVEIVFSGNPMRGEIAIMDEIVNMLKHSRLEYLSLNLCGIDPPLLAKLAEGIRSSLTIQHLELKGNLRLTDESIVEFLRVIGAHRALRKVELDLSGVTLFKQKYVQSKLSLLHSDRSLCLQALVSTKTCPRLGTNALIKLLPMDILRRLSIYLPEPVLETFQALGAETGQAQATPEQQAGNAAQAAAAPVAAAAAVPPQQPAHVQAQQQQLNYQAPPHGITVTQHLSVIPPTRPDIAPAVVNQHIAAVEGIG